MAGDGCMNTLLLTPLSPSRWPMTMALLEAWDEVQIVPVYRREMFGLLVERCEKCNPS